MRKVIAGINMTLDGFCDHTSMIADDELHQHYTDLLKNSETLIYGRITYKLMEDYWPEVVKNSTGNKSTDDFAVTIDKIEKIVFSRTLHDVSWKTARLAKRSIKEEISALKQQQGGDILIGSPSMIVSALKLDLVDEYQLCIHPTIAGRGLQLFRDIKERVDLKLIRTKVLNGVGSVVMYYARGDRR